MKFDWKKFVWEIVRLALACMSGAAGSQVF